MRYLVCNTTTHKNTDYAKPITVHKSTDYRTSYGTNHRYIAPHPQDFDARVKFPKRQIKNPILKDDFYITDNMRSFTAHKSVKDPLDIEAPKRFYKLHYLRSEEEKAFRDPPRPIAPVKSEMSEEYCRKSAPAEPTRVSTPNMTCKMRAFGRDEQPPFRPEENGINKHLDIYLSTTRASYVPYNQQRQEGYARKDIVTYYDASGVPRGGKGYGPKLDTRINPLVKRGERSAHKTDAQRKSFFQTIAPFYSGKSTYGDAFQSQTYSDFWPYLFESGVEFKQVFPNCTPWQASAATGMFCTENCHIGTGWPVRAVVDIGKIEKEPPPKANDYCQCVYKENLNTTTKI